MIIHKWIVCINNNQNSVIMYEKYTTNFTKQTIFIINILKLYLLEKIIY